MQSLYNVLCGLTTPIRDIHKVKTPKAVLFCAFPAISDGIQAGLGTRQGLVTYPDNKRERAGVWGRDKAWLTYPDDKRERALERASGDETTTGVPVTYVRTQTTSGMGTRLGVELVTRLFPRRQVGTSERLRQRLVTNYVPRRQAGTSGSLGTRQGLVTYPDDKRDGDETRRRVTRLFPVCLISYIGP